MPLLLGALAVAAAASMPALRHRGGETRASILVVGSVNADVIIEVDRLPVRDETVTSRHPNTGTVVTGGKGANQAVAAARLAGRSDFACCFGSDAAALEAELSESGVDMSASRHIADTGSGKGYVFLLADGSVSSVVVGGANAAWTHEDAQRVAALATSADVLLLQQEVPEAVNEEVAAVAAAASVAVFLDVGGEERPISDEMLRRVDFLTPNLTELARLTGMSVDTECEVIAAARSLLDRGARNVLVTMGEDGSLLVGGAVGGGAVVQEPSFPVDHAIDATGAGDAYRAAFAVAYAEGQPVRECMRFAAAAGALAVTKLGAVPSLPSRSECELLMARGRHKQPKPEQLKPARRRFLADGVASPEAADGAVLTGGAVSGGRAVSSGSQWPSSCPWQFASRLNSMKDRADLWDGNDGVLGWVERQGSISGLNLVDFNFPQHLPSAGVSVSEAEEALAAAGLRAGAICMRYPKEFQAGGFTHPDAAMRRKAIDLTLEGCRWALSLGARELVVWSAYDGYDYPFQADHTIMWRRLVDAFREVCDAFPSLRISLEFKPTDENTRWFAVPSTGAALLLVDDIDRPNMGLTLDVGHCLAAGENPAQSAAMVGSRGKLWGVQLNDGYTRLGAEDGLAFGSVHPTLALEMVWWLQRYGFDGHVYFDTFPRNEDPVREAEYNIRRCRALWEKARRLDKQIETCITRQDAMSALEMLEEDGA